MGVATVAVDAKGAVYCRVARSLTASTLQVELANVGIDYILLEGVKLKEPHVDETTAEQVAVKAGVIYVTCSTPPASEALGRLGTLQNSRSALENSLNMLRVSNSTLQDSLNDVLDVVDDILLINVRALLDHTRSVACGKAPDEPLT